MRHAETGDGVNNLASFIKPRGYKLYEVAEATQIPTRTLHEYCRGRTAIPRYRLEALAAFLECPVSMLLDETHQEAPPRAGKGDLAAQKTTTLERGERSPSAPQVTDTSEDAGPLRAETRHLLGRQEWLASVIAQIQTEIPKKLLVLHGPIGVGKSSELNRLAHAFMKQNSSQVMVLSLPAREPRDPEASLDLCIGMLLSASRAAPFPANASRQTRIKLALTALAEQPRSTVILLDNAEGTLTEEGTLAPCWEAFLTNVVRGQHQATLILATKEWPGWPGRDSQLVAEIAVPPLTLEESVLLLQRLGLESVPLAALEAISQRVACIPLCLEWIATIAHDPLVHDAWEAFEVQEESSTESHLDAAQRLMRLLEHPTLLGEHLASRLTPLLEHILDRHLSADAKRVLEHLAVVSIPLGKPALHVFCSRPAWLKQLRNASLLASYTNRIQVLPTVASSVRAQLSPEQVYELEERMIEALTKWVEDGNIQDDEAGSVVTELAILLLTHHRLLDAAQLLIRYSWLSFRFGHGPRLALIAQDVLLRFDWHSTNEYECAVLALVQILFPLLGKPVETRKYINYQHIRDVFLTGTLPLQAEIESYVTHLLLLDAMSTLQFEEAQTILNAYRSRLAARQTIRLEQHPALLTEQAYLLGKQCEYLEELGGHQNSRRLRDQTITLYRQRVALYSPVEEEVPLNREHRKQALAYYLSYLAYHLSRAGLNEEALQVIERAIALQEQGYAYIGVLATSYGEKSQILMALGRFREALLFDEKAMAEIQRCIHAGDGTSQEEAPIYAVNRGRLYLRLGRIDEAEHMLQQALPCISAPRRKYAMFAKEALEEIRQWRQRTGASQHQLDWRWVERFRDLSAQSSTWWLTWAGPFTQEEQREWDRLFMFPFDEAVKAALERLMKNSRERELETAIREQREPRLRYPALPIEEIQREFDGLQQLGEDIRQHEPNAIVRRLYQEVIEEELDYLCLLKAISEEDTEHFWEHNLRLFPLPSVDDMNSAFAHITSLLRQGAVFPEVASVSQQIEEMLRTRFHLSSDPEQDDIQERERPAAPSDSATPTQAERKLSVQTVKRFFEAVLQESGYDKWRVVIDLNATGARVSPGARQLILPEHQFTLAEVRHLFSHELAGHAARFMAGEHSLLGLLGIHTRNYLPTEEGLALYHDRQEAQRSGSDFNDEGLRWMTFAVGLASGVMTPPQTFLTLFTFFEALTFLHGRLRYPHVEREKTQAYAHTYALSLCLRIYRGVPDLGRAGVCFLQDALYFHGLRQIERAVAEDETVLERLAVGACALEDLPALQELGIVAPPASLRTLATASDLDAYILSFDQEPEKQQDEHG